VWLAILGATAPPHVRPAAAAAPLAPLVALGSTPIGPDNVDRLEDLTRLGKGRVAAATYSPDGRLIAVASGIGVSLYDAASLVEVAVLDTEVPAHDVAFSGDGRLLAAAGAKRASVWRVSDGARLRTFDGDLGEANRSTLALSPDGETLAMVNRRAPGTVELYRVADGTPLRTIEAPFVNGVTFAPDGQAIAASRSGAVTLWRTADGTLLHDLAGGRGFQAQAVFSPDGQVMASPWEEQTIRLWRVSDTAVLQTFQAPQIVSRLAFSPDGQLLVSGHGQSVLEDLLAPRPHHVWRVADGALVRTLEGHVGDVWSVSIAPDGQTLLSAADDQTVRRWHLSDGAPIGAFGTYTDTVASLAFAPDGRTLAAGSGSSGLPITAKPLPGGAVRLWRLEDGTPLWTVPHGDGGAPRSAAFSPDGQALAVGGEARTIELLRASDGAVLRRLQGHRLPVNSVAWSTDGQVLVSGSSDGTFALWPTTDGSALRIQRAHAERVSSAIPSRDGQTVRSGGWDGTVRIWGASDGQLVRSLEGPEAGVSQLVVSPDEQTLAATARRETVVRFWQASDGAVLRTVDVGKDGLSGATFSPDGQVLAVGAGSTSGSNSGSIVLIRVADGTLLRAIDKPADGITSLAFSPDGRLLAAGSRAGVVGLWGVR
jgi:WD40 repeat protein